MTINSLISIIVPVYNVKDYLEKCITSMLNQTYSNLEIIIVDDGSTDGSSDICKNYAEKDSRIKYIHKENGGQASARNLGLDICRGEYIGFVDSDDWILPNMYERLMEVMQENDVDIVMCNNYKDEVNEDENTPGRIKIYSKDEFMPLALTDKINGNPFDKLYKRYIFDDLRFPLGICAEDFAILHLIMNNAERLAVISDRLYVYNTLRGNSTTNDPEKDLANSYDRANILDDRLIFAEEHYPDCCLEIYKKASLFYMSSYMKMVSHLNNRIYEEYMFYISEWFMVQYKYYKYNSIFMKLCITNIIRGNNFMIICFNLVRKIRKKFIKKKKTSSVDYLV